MEATLKRKKHYHVTPKHIEELLAGDYFTKNVTLQEFNSATTMVGGSCVSDRKYRVWLNAYGEIRAVQEVDLHGLKLHIKSLTKVFKELG